MMHTASDSDYHALFARSVHRLTAHNLELRGGCPFHQDVTPSWTGNRLTGLWKCFGCGAQGNASQFAEHVGERVEMGNGNKRKIVATYPYHDAHGTLLYEVVRYEPKGFKQRRPDGKGGWVWKLGDVRRVLYALAALRDVETVFVVEGEKDADGLRRLGFPASCNPEGAGKWRDAYNQCLAGKRVVILPDNDEPGEQHALHVAGSLLSVAAAVKIVRLSGLPPKGDVSDWLNAGHTREELAEIVTAAPILRLEDLSPEQERTGSSLPLTSLRDLLNEPEELLAWLVDKVLPAGGFSLLVGKPKSGKSTLARVLALAVALARGFLDRATTQGPVIYLALEEKRSEVKKHFRDMGATGEEEIYIYAASVPVDALQQIRVVVEEKKPVLLIIDPLFKLTRIKDGNDYAQVTQVLEPLLILARETNTHVLCVHHAGKGEREGGDSILGSTAIFAAVDTALLLKRTERYRTISSIQRSGGTAMKSWLRSA